MQTGQGLAGWFEVVASFLRMSSFLIHSDWLNIPTRPDRRQAANRQHVTFKLKLSPPPVSLCLSLTYCWNCFRICLAIFIPCFFPQFFHPISSQTHSILLYKRIGMTSLDSLKSVPACVIWSIIWILSRRTAFDEQAIKNCHILPTFYNIELLIRAG